MRIAIADDEADIRQYFRRLLPRLGHEVIGEAKNGRELIEVCRNKHPDLIITDIRMGEPDEIDGIQATAEIGRTQNIPVIIVSSNDPPETNGHPLVVEYLVKPIGIPELQAALTKVENADIV
jgi:CheY-like chemotaxis protein